MRALSFVLLGLTLAGCGSSAPSPGSWGADTTSTVDVSQGLDTGAQPTGDTQSTPDAQSEADADTQTDAGLIEPGGPTDQELKDLGIVKLDAADDGMERGVAATDDKGGVTFYSATHKTLVTLESLAKGEKSSDAAPGVKAHVSVTKDGSVMALMVDPSGKLAPEIYAGELKDGQIEVDGGAGWADGSLEVTYDATAKSPFPSDKLAIAGLASMALRFTMWTTASMAVTAATKSIFSKLCLSVSPLYTGTCALLADIAGEVAGLLVGGVKLKFEGKLVWGEVKKMATDAAVNFILGKTCEQAVGATLLAVGPTSNNPWPLYDANVGLWKSAAYKANYMMTKADKDKLTDAKQLGAAKGSFKATHALLTVLRPFVQRDIYQIHAGKEPPKLGDNKVYSFLMKQVENIAGELKVVNTQINILTLIQSITTYQQLWDGVLIQQKTFIVQKVSVQVTVKDWKPKYFDQSFACALGAIDGVSGYLNGAQGLGLDVKHMQLVNDTLKLVNALLDELYKAIWGGAIATPKCYPDLYEPNDKAKPKSGIKNLGAKVSITDVTSTEGDVDWYSLPLGGPFAKVQAGVAGRLPKGGSDCNKVPAGAKLCVSMYWWSNVIELAGGYPQPIGSEVCGSVSSPMISDFVDPEFTVPWWNVSKVTGETGQTLLVRVRQPSGQKLNIPYTVMMFGGSIF